MKLIEVTVYTEWIDIKHEMNNYQTYYQKKREGKHSSTQIKIE